MTEDITTRGRNWWQTHTMTDNPNDFFDAIGRLLAERDALQGALAKVAKEIDDMIDVGADYCTDGWLISIAPDPTLYAQPEDGLTE